MALRLVLALMVLAFLSSNVPADDLIVATWNVEWFFDNDASDNESDVAKEHTAPSLADYEWKTRRIAETVAAIHPAVFAM